MQSVECRMQNHLISDFRMRNVECGIEEKLGVSECGVKRRLMVTVDVDRVTECDAACVGFGPGGTLREMNTASYTTGLQTTSLRYSRLKICATGFRLAVCLVLATFCEIFHVARADGDGTNLLSDTPKTFAPRTNDFD